MHRLAFVAALAVTTASAQSVCEGRCNQQASECLKTCGGAPKDAQKPEQRSRLMRCLSECEQQTRQCKASCSPAPRP